MVGTIGIYRTLFEKGEGGGRFFFCFLFFFWKPSIKYKNNYKTSQKQYILAVLVQLIESLDIQKLVSNCILGRLKYRP